MYENADSLSLPMTFEPLELYMSGFKVHYHHITELPDGFLSNLSVDGKQEEGWHYVDVEAGEIRIFFDPRVGVKRQRFTIAHEWGHVFQQIDLEFKSAIEAMPDEYERQLIIERLADKFAGYYLVPRPVFRYELAKLVDLISPQLFASVLSAKFDVSEGVIKICNTYYREVNFVRR